MGCPFTVRELEEELAERIQALDATPFDQNKDGQRPAAWREATVPLTVLEDASPREHLLFNVWVERSENTGERRDAPGEFAKVESDVVVLFLYNLRAADQLPDSRLASDAAHAIVRALMARDLAELVDVRLVHAWRPLVSDDGTKLLAEVRFTVAHDLPL
jgi:hypothetical protein